MRSYFECHITIEGEQQTRSHIRSLVEGLGWKFSAIDGDIVMGDGVKLYATRHYNVRIGDDKVLSILLDTAKLLEGEGVVVTRRKVERVIYDDRSSKVRPCNGGCIECHLDDLKVAATG